MKDGALARERCAATVVWSWCTGSGLGEPDCRIARGPGRGRYTVGEPRQGVAHIDGLRVKQPSTVLTDEKVAA